MKISELIKELQGILDKEGDLDVTCWPYDGQGSFHDLGTVDVLDEPENKNDRTGEVKPSRRIVNLDS